MIKDIKFAGIKSGIKKEKKDLGIIVFPNGTTFSGVTTKNKFVAACVEELKEKINSSDRQCKAILVNSGNANALTGKEGRLDIQNILNKLAEELKCKPEELISLSTGVIGKRMPVELIKSQIPILLNDLSSSCENFAEAILTTDLTKKIIKKEIKLSNGESVNLLGITKGSGMIQPNMGTMLAFIISDACLSKELSDKILKKAISKSFNRITVDSDTSTNDSCLLFATNQIKINSVADIKLIEETIVSLSQDLAKLIVEDGEGATKFVEIKISKALNEKEASAIFYSIANSPLVKTAIFGQSANFGRILSAAGKIESSLKPDKVKLFINDVLLFSEGKILSENQPAIKSSMFNKKIFIELDLACGNYNFTGWTCDFSYDYVKINADYN